MEDVKPADAIYFLTLELRNIRCFSERQILDLRDPKDPDRPAMWTVLLGENGTGKTTLLQMLAMWAVSKGKPRAGMYVPSILAIHTAGLVNRDRKRRMEVRANASVQRAGVHTLTVGYLMKSSGGKAKFSHPPEDNARDLFLYAYGASRNHLRQTNEEERDWAEVDTLFRTDATLMSPEEWLLRLDYRAADAGRSGSANQALDRLKTMLVDLLPDVSGVHLIPPEARGLAASAGRVEFDTPYGRVSLKDLSLGYQTLIAWTVDLAFRLSAASPDAENPLATPCVVLVDEIDLHLHPAWQRILHRQLRAWFPCAQFIVTAHSPLVVQSAFDENLVVLHREGDHVVIDNNPQVIRQWRVDQLLTSDLFRLSSPRSEEVEADLRRRTELLTKDVRTETEEHELGVLEEGLENLPTETGRDQESMDLIHRAAALLRARGHT